MRRFASILLGSVIAAAFLGPGTVATASKAGAGHGLELLWTLLFATVACVVLQESSARLTVASGRTLGAALAVRRSGRGSALRWAVLVAVFLGCAAYEAGNILGGVAGAGLVVDLPGTALTAISVLAAGLLLWLGGTRGAVAVLSLLVAVMGVAFLLTAWRLRPPFDEVLAGLFVPRMPSGSLVLGLVGTTVVPYNLFLGSGLARGRRLGETRLGLAVAIGLGGLISMGVMVVGTAVSGELTFDKLSRALSAQLGGGADLLFAVGLFAAGFSSAVTAPLAAAVTARGLLAAAGDASWNDTGRRFRGVWLAVLAVGALFGLLEVKPIPAIILAQAFNGLLLPLVAVFLLLAVNDRRLVGDRLNGAWSNAWTTAVVVVTVLLGCRFLAAAAAALGIVLADTTVLAVSAVLVSVAAVPLVAHVRRLRGDPSQI